MSSVFGGGASRSLPNRITVASPGYTFTSQDGGNVLNRNQTPEQTAFDTRFPRILGDIDTLRGQADPATGLVRSALLSRVANDRSRAIGNLRNNLAQRRVLGSSFGEFAQTAAERDFAQQDVEAELQALLTGFDLYSRALQSETETLVTGINRDLQEFGAAAGLAPQTSQLLFQNAQFQEQLASQEALGFGQLIGNLVGLGGALAFGPSGAAAGAAKSKAATAAPSVNSLYSIGRGF